MEVFYEGQCAALINTFAGPVFPVGGDNWGNRDTCWALSATAAWAENVPGELFPPTRPIFRA